MSAPHDATQAVAVHVADTDTIAAAFGLWRGVRAALFVSWLASTVCRRYPPNSEEGQMTRLAVVFGLAAAITVTGVVRGQSKTDPTLNKMAVDWAAAFNAKDAAKLASFYADDGVYMPPNLPMVKGRANLEARFKREFQEGFTNLQLKPMESAISGSQAFEAGTATVEAPGGLTENGKHLVVFKRVGNEWKIAYNIHNGDKPAAPSK